MRIGIIGGGISGLYMASLLKRDHEVFIIEKKNWGGDIQYCYIEDKCYPVSTVFVMPTDRLLKRP
jgi:protoporphyrinogen oxidase